MREITNAQLTLEKSTIQLCAKVKQILNNIEKDEQPSQRKYPRLAQSPAFLGLQLKVSSYAIRKIEVEWHLLEQMISAGQDLGDCHCEILLRFGLPCKHHL